ncbi:MAG: ATP phosphoribosyltransferase [Candidatus Hodgkinia cicadicola]
MSNVILGIPSKGRVSRIVDNLIRINNLHLISSSTRSYFGNFSVSNNWKVKLMSATSIANELINGNLNFGLTGLDLMLEVLKEDTSRNFIKMIKKFELSTASIGFLVPISWYNVNSIDDLLVLSLNKDIIISTKYVNVTQNYINSKGWNTFKVVSCSSTSEIEPFSDKCDIIVDVLSSGKTAKHNLLKPIIGGKIIDTCLCMFYNCRPAMALKDIELIHLLCDIIY